MDLKAHSTVSTYFPTAPSFIDLFEPGHKSSKRFRAEKDGTLIQILPPGGVCGSWWPLSGSSVQLSVDGSMLFLRYDEGHMWVSVNDGNYIIWTRKRDRDVGSDRLSSQKTPAKNKAGSIRNSTPNLSRFRTCVLPLDNLDLVHREQLSCMGLRVCRHLDVGRVLVTTRRFDDGEIVLYSRVPNFDVNSDEEVLGLIDPSHPSCCYLLVPRTKKLYYNKGSFSDSDPISSGDLWYLVNHSHRPNVEVLLTQHGIQFKAKRPIQANEPLVWTYPPCFFGKDGGESVDLPQNVVPDDSVILRE